jgi:hypothetical protein
MALYKNRAIGGPNEVRFQVRSLQSIWRPGDAPVLQRESDCYETRLSSTHYEPRPIHTLRRRHFLRAADSQTKNAPALERPLRGLFVHPEFRALVRSELDDRSNHRRCSGSRS